MGLCGCGNGTSAAGGSFDSGVTGTSGSALLRQEISGSIATELQFSGAEIGSAHGPTIVNGARFTTTVLSQGVGLLALGESGGGVRGFTLTFPGDSPVFSAENSALAIIFMEPGFLKLDPAEAKDLITRIRASNAFEPFVQLLLANASIRLDLLSGDPTYVAAREALVQSLGNPFAASQPMVRTGQGDQMILSNPSPRSLRVVRSDSRGSVVLPQLLPPYGSITDQNSKATYTFYGLGPAATLPTATQLVEETYHPTLLFAVVLPLLELAAGQRISPNQALEFLQQLSVPSFNPRTNLVSPNVLATLMAQDGSISIGEMAGSISGSFSSLSKLVTAGSYLAGLAFSIAAILKFKQHKDNPTQIPIGAPISLVYLAAALLFLPSIIDVPGHDFFRDNPPPTGPPG